MFSDRKIKGFNTNVNNFLVKTGKLVLWFFALAFIIYKLITNSSIQYTKWLNEIEAGNFFLLLFLIVFILAFVNWGLESIKWQNLAGKIQKISFLTSCKGVLLGIAMGMITPKRLGEFAGKVIVLNKSKRVEGAIINMVGTLCQLLVTLVVGGVSLIILFYLKHIKSFSFFIINDKAVILSALTISLIACFYLFRKKIIAYLTKFKPLYKVYKKLLILKNITRNDFLRLLFLSFLRYIVFMTQCFLLFILAGLNLSIQEAVLFQSVVFLILTILPITAFSELAIKCGVAILVFSNIFADSINSYHSYEISLIFANGVLWIINLAIPALVGLIWGTGYGLSLKKSIINVK